MTEISDTTNRIFLPITPETVLKMVNNSLNLTREKLDGIIPPELIDQGFQGSREIYLMEMIQEHVTRGTVDIPGIRERKAAEEGRYFRPMNFQAAANTYQNVTRTR